MDCSQIYDRVLATHGEGTFVIKLSDGVYVFSSGIYNQSRSHFSFDPWSFYKFGYFEAAEDFTYLEDTLKHIDRDVKALTPENKWRYLCSLVTAEEVKAAWEEFKKKLDWEE